MIAKLKEFLGDVAIGRNVAIGGKAAVKGSMEVAKNLTVKGMLDAPNVMGVVKGVFFSMEQLNSVYSQNASEESARPKDGWVAGIIGESDTIDVYAYDGGNWKNTGKSIHLSGLSIELDMDFSTKADRTYVDEQLEKKVDKTVFEDKNTEVEEALAGKASEEDMRAIQQELSTKASTETTDELEGNIRQLNQNLIDGLQGKADATVVDDLYDTVRSLVMSMEDKVDIPALYTCLAKVLTDTVRGKYRITSTGTHTLCHRNGLRYMAIGDKLFTTGTANLNPGDYDVSFVFDNPHEIPADAFKDVTTLRELYIPSYIRSIGDYAFNGSTNLGSIVCDAMTPPSTRQHTFNGLQLDSIILRVHSVTISLMVYETGDWKNMIITNI